MNAFSLLQNRKSRIPAGVFLLLGVVSLWLPARGGQAAEVEEPVQLVHQAALIYAEVTHPEHLWPLVLDASYQRQLQQALPLRQLWASGEFARLRALVEGIQRHTGQPVLKVLSAAAARRAAVAVEPISQTALVILKAQDEAAAESLSRALRETIRQYTQEHNLPLEPGQSDYEGVTVYAVGSDVFWAHSGPWFLASNTYDGIQAALDRLSGNETNHLGKTQDYRKARQLVGEGATGWGLFRTGPLLLIPQVQQTLTGKQTEVAVEYLVGGVLEALARAPLVAFRLDAHSGRLRLTEHIPFDARKVRPHRRWFFAPAQEQGGGLLRVPGTILSMTLYRDLAPWWKQRERLFNEQALAAFDEAESNLGLLLGQLDLEEDLLRHLGPRLRVVVARTQFPPERSPQIKLPAGAVVFTLKDPQRAGQALMVAYQRVVSTINVIGIQEKVPPLLLGSEDYRGVRCYVARFFVLPDAKLPRETLYYNFSPSAALVDRWFILSSHEQLLKKLVDQFKQHGDPDAGDLNTAVEVDLKQLQATLADNQATLVAQTLLQQGTPLDQARKQTEQFLELLKRLDRAAVRLRVRKDQLVLELETGLPR